MKSERESEKLYDSHALVGIYMRAYPSGDGAILIKWLPFGSIPTARTIWNVNQTGFLVPPRKRLGRLRLGFETSAFR